jgi:hypothetical protein
MQGETISDVQDLIACGLTDEEITVYLHGVLEEASARQAIASLRFFEKVPVSFNN